LLVMREPDIIGILDWLLDKTLFYKG
jgi:hypothetical protein